MFVKKFSIQLKAAFLLMIFSLNTIIGFACAIGFDMSFNSKHHDDEEATEAVVHVHGDGKKHIHKEKTNSHNHSNSHHHEEANKHKTDNNEKDNCCNDKVIKFDQLDKSLTPSVNAVFNPVFFTAFLASFYNANILFSSQIVPNTRYFVRGHHPPIPDIRIAIQSFQI